MKGIDFLNNLKKNYPDLLEADIRQLMEFSSSLATSDPSFYIQEFKENEIFKKGLDELRSGKPVEYITNKAKFLGIDLYVDEKVLIPRNETEQLVVKSVDFICGKRIRSVADIGAGSGCISSYLKINFPDLKVYAVEQSQNACQVAMKNYSRLGLKVQMFMGDALKPLIENNIRIDALVSNPPYITKKEFVQPSVVKYEPKEALYIQRESLFEKIFRDVNQVCNLPFYMAFEMSPCNEKLIRKLMKKYLNKKYNTTFKFSKDMNGITRFVEILLN